MVDKINMAIPAPIALRGLTRRSLQFFQVTGFEFLVRKQGGAFRPFIPGINEDGLIFEREQILREG